MENERAKEKKQVLRNFMWATMFILISLFTAIGILFYMLIPDLQISHGTEKLLLLAVPTLLLAAFFAWIFWHRSAFKKYTKEYEKEIEQSKKSKILIFVNSRKFTVFILLMILLAMGIGWYIGHHRSAQKLLNAEPVKQYKIVALLPPKTPIPNTLRTPASTHTHETEDTSVTLPIPDQENTDAHSSNQGQNDLSESPPGMSGETPISA